MQEIDDELTPQEQLLQNALDSLTAAKMTLDSFVSGVLNGTFKSENKNDYLRIDAHIDAAIFHIKKSQE
jgi:hypothetical protein